LVQSGSGSGHHVVELCSRSRIPQAEKPGVFVALFSLTHAYGDVKKMEPLGGKFLDHA
jgi:hypothetical protein